MVVINISIAKAEIAVTLLVCGRSLIGAWILVIYKKAQQLQQLGKCDWLHAHNPLQTERTGFELDRPSRANSIRVLVVDGFNQQELVRASEGPEESVE